jgi:hypothetical protein
MERSISSMHSRLSTWPLAARASTGAMLTCTGLSPIGLTWPTSACTRATARPPELSVFSARPSMMPSSWARAAFRRSAVRSMALKVGAACGQRR